MINQVAIDLHSFALKFRIIRITLYDNVLHLYSSVAISSTAGKKRKQTSIELITRRPNSNNLSWRQLAEKRTSFYCRIKNHHLGENSYQCIKEKFISLHTSQNFSNLTVFRFSKRDNNKRQSVIKPSAIIYPLQTLPSYRSQEKSWRFCNLGTRRASRKSPKNL